MRPTFLLWHNPDWDIIVPPIRWTDHRAVRWIRLFQLQDMVWVLLFGIMIAMSPTEDTKEVTLLVTLGIVQIAEPKAPFARTPRGKVLWILAKLVLAYLLIGFTGGFASSYYVLLLLPVVSA